MKVLSIHQPWAWCIAEGHKVVENRTWSTRYRGPLLIQASKAWAPRVVAATLEALHGEGLIPELPDLGVLHAERGHVIASVQLVGVREVGMEDPDPWAVPGSFAFELAEVVRVEPLALRGYQGLFNLPLDLVEKLRPAGG